MSAKNEEWLITTNNLIVHQYSTSVTKNRKERKRKGTKGQIDSCWCKQQEEGGRREKRDKNNW
jgi:hypothetical protein